MKKTRLISRPAKMFCMLFLVIMLLSMVTMASANSTNYYFVQTGNFANGVYTTAELKETSSSVLASNNSSTCDIYTVAVYGSNSTSSIGSDMTYGSYKSIPTNSSCLLPNLVNENGRSHARLRLWTATNETMTMNVTWVTDV